METSHNPFDAFCRNDKFGLCGKANKPIFVRILFAFSFLWIPIKLLFAIVCLCLANLSCRVASLLPKTYRVSIASYLVGLFSAILAFGLGLVVTWRKLPTENLSFQDRFQKEEDGASFGAFVCNHSSWSDVVIITARYSVSFMARSGTDRLPFVGIISKVIGAILVDREASAAAQSASPLPTGDVSKLASASSSSSASITAASDADAPSTRRGVAVTVSERLVARFLYDEECRQKRREQRLSGQSSECFFSRLFGFGCGSSSSSSSSSASSPTSSPTSSSSSASSSSSSFSSSSTAGPSDSPKVVGSDSYAEAGRLPHLVVFPEATTTNNRYILPFKRGVFVAGVPIRIIIFKYSNSLFGMFSPCWEAIDIFWHIFFMLAIPFHFVTCYEGPVYCPNEEEVKNPTLFANNVRQVMIEAGDFISSSATFETKKVYHTKLGLMKNQGKQTAVTPAPPSSSPAPITATTTTSIKADAVPSAAGSFSPSPSAAAYAAAAAAAVACDSAASVKKNE